jgi:SAM-dependent methyltransferase
MRRRLDVPGLIEQHLEAGEPTGWFEPVYAGAGRRSELLPWHVDGPHPYVVDWLDEPVADPPGRRTVVVGCGLGDDAAHLAERGLAVTAFDVASTAVRRARRRHRRAAVDWQVADLLSPPEDWQGAFDLVVEVHTVPWLPGVVRDAAMQAIGSLAGPGGVVLVVTLLAGDSGVAKTSAGPPWPQAPAELAAYRAAGLERVALEHADADEQGLLEARLTWRRPS